MEIKKLDVFLKISVIIGILTGGLSLAYYFGYFLPSLETKRFELDKGIRIVDRERQVQENEKLIRSTCGDSAFDVAIRMLRSSGNGKVTLSRIQDISSEEWMQLREYVQAENAKCLQLYGLEP